MRTSSRGLGARRVLALGLSCVVLTGVLPSAAQAAPTPDGDTSFGARAGGVGNERPEVDVLDATPAETASGTGASAGVAADALELPEYEASFDCTGPGIWVTLWENTPASWADSVPAWSEDPTLVEGGMVAFNPIDTDAWGGEYTDVVDSTGVEPGAWSPVASYFGGDPMYPALRTWDDVTIGRELPDGQLYEATFTVDCLAPEPGRAVRSDGYMFVTSVGEDGKLWTRSRNESTNGWSDWTSRSKPSGVHLVGAPEAIRSDGYMFVTVLGDDGRLWTRSRNESTNSWSGWTDRGRPSDVGLIGSPEAAVSDGRLWVSALGSDGKIWIRSRSESANTWSSWTSLSRPSGEYLSGTPALAHSGTTTYLAAIDTDGDLWLRTYNEKLNTWGSWLSRGSQTELGLVGSPSIAASDGTLFLAATGADGVLYVSTLRDSFVGWHDFVSPAGLASSPELVTTDGRLFVLASTPWGGLAMLARTESSNEWAPWKDLGSPGDRYLMGAPSAVVSDGYLFVPLVDSEGNLVTVSRRASTNAWSGWVSRSHPTGVWLWV